MANHNQFNNSYNLGKKSYTTIGGKKEKAPEITDIEIVDSQIRVIKRRIEIGAYTPELYDTYLLKIQRLEAELAELKSKTNG